MRVAQWLLAGIALLVVVSSRAIESNDEDLDSVEVVDRPPPHVEWNPRPKRNAAKSNNDEADEGTILICNEADGDDAACSCEDIYVHCNGLHFTEDDGTETQLDTLDVRLAKQKKAFRPLLAFFRNNAITSLRKNRMPEGMEESLSSLDLMNNRISHIDAGAFHGFKNISKLFLTDNRIREIRSEYFTGEIGSTLRTLDLRNNMLTKLANSPFERLSNLKKLVLDGNYIKLDKDTFKGLENLEMLSMDECGLVDMDSSVFLPLKKLKSLSIRQNPFTNVPLSVSDIPTLDLLDLSESQITEIHKDSFADDTQLTEIIIEDMPYLIRIDDCAFCGAKLKEVSLENSRKLSFIHSNAFGFARNDAEKAGRLQSLKLSYTNITNIPVDLLDWSKMRMINLAGIPLVCSCDLASLLQEADLFNTRCTFPPGTRRRPFAAFKMEKCADSQSSGSILTAE